jgi:hypothetical protein
MRPSCAHILLLFTCILNLLPVQGQLDLGLDSARYMAFIRSVKQFNEFVNRFNQDFYEVPDLDTTSSIVLDRKQSILNLFNRNDPRFDPHSPEYSEAYIEQVLRFVDDIVGNEIYLNKHSDQIKAIVTASVLYHGDPNSLNIILTQEVDAPNMVRWVISDVDADFLGIPERDTTQLQFLSPVSNELGFMDLARAFREPEQMIDYICEDFKYDRLSVFLHHVNTGSLQLKNITGMIYRVDFGNKYEALICNSLYRANIESWSICVLKELEH